PRRASRGRAGRGAGLRSACADRTASRAADARTARTSAGPRRTNSGNGGRVSSAGAFRILIGELAVVGVDPGQACRDAGVDPAVLDDPARPLGLRALGRILARAEDAARDPHLGLHVARAARGRGVLTYVFRAQPTVERAL